MVLGPMEGVEQDGSGGESMGAVVEASGAKIELLKRRAHNLFKAEYHSSKFTVSCTYILYGKT